MVAAPNALNRCDDDEVIDEIEPFMVDDGEDEADDDELL